MNRLSLFVVVAFGALVTACGSSANGSCSLTSSGTTYCMEFTGTSFGTASSVENACKSEGGTYSSNACASADRLGHCTVDANTANEFVSYFYSTGGTTLSEAQFICTAMAGTWAAN